GIMTTPALTGLSPNQGPTAGGTTVTLTGTNLGDVTTVRFGTTATAFTIVSPTQITATAPPGSEGPVQITAISPGGTSGGVAYYYVVLPTLTAVSPGQGPTAGGTTVTITGTNLLNATTVRFGGTAAAFSVVSATQITATSPPGSMGFAQITVLTPGGTGGGAAFQYVALPTLTDLSPDQGPLTGGTTVTLTGSNLGDVTAVRFGGTAAAFTIVSATQITATAPAGSAGAVQVAVTSPGGTSAGLTYTRIALPGI
ncbi:IPT/TIG domain-containing protein, partial [Streptomyces sp. NPDC058394]|uniref:IPT/TIG domain-containing protein n=1 Tax=Streptomyces sp. NPDC058394 TaxID=3346477 RepID=UPI003651963A